MSVKRVALVTGAGMGIGKAIASRLGQDGLSVAVNDIDEATAQATAEALQAEGVTAIGVQGDISQRDQVFRLVETVVGEFGRLDVMVCNAGIVQVDPILNIQEDDFDRLFSINVKGVLWCAQAAAQQMMTQGGGKIINAGSVASFLGHPLLGTYGASKFAVRGLTQIMAREFADHGITVNAYCPGIVDTGMWETIDSRASEVMGTPRGSMVEAAQGMITLKRMEQPEDVAKFVSFLASPDADYITGQCMMVDGGIVMN
ncbi:acetoin reductase [Parahaliea maris]|uniref:diacetyl reductase [(S)-acetoin forming] n=1 Tax=Parahaliea maris TaxID=2716870 RepID=A0A5C8ZWV4_9GAMM|nr:acetoin reductase [Parahaliea maris]TXS92956.1 acetoin reductase [Parahaliea maris]